MKSSEYWQQRFALLEEEQYKNSSKYIKVLQEEYDKALSNIEKDITNWYTRIAVNNQVTYSEAQKLLNKKELQEFKWTIEEYIKKGQENAITQQWAKQLENASARVHIDRLEAIKIQIQNELEHLINKQYIEITELEKQQYQDSYYKSAYEIQKGMEQYWNIQALDTNKIDKVISKPWTTDNQTFSDRIWKNKNELLNTLQKEIVQTTIRGDSLDDIIKKISKDFDISKNKAGRLVMTESAFFSSVGQKECFNSLGVEKYEIVATLDSRTSEICQEMDGKVFDMKDYEVGITAPPFHCNCRSCTAPYFDDEFTQGEQRVYRDENGKTAYTNSDMKYKEWKEKYVDNGLKSNVNNDKINKNVSKEDKKMQYIDITDEMYKKAKSNKGKVEKQKFFEYDGEIYKVDGHNIVYKHDEREIEVAKLLNKTFGGNVKILPNINYPQGIKTPDYIFRGERIDLKRITSKRINDCVKTAIRDSEKQSHNFIIDNTLQTVSDDAILKQIDEIYKMGKFSWVNTIYVLKEDKFIKIYKRK